MSQVICDECGEPIINDIRCEPCFGPLVGTPEWFWHDDNDEARIQATGDVWDEYADAFFERHGWEKDHMRYTTDSPDARRTGTLWVETRIDITIGWGEDQTGNIAMEDTGIPAHEADRLLTEGWDNAESEAYERWCEAEGFDEGEDEQ